MTKDNAVTMATNCAAFLQAPFVVLYEPKTEGHYFITARAFELMVEMGMRNPWDVVKYVESAPSSPLPDRAALTTGSGVSTF